MKQNITFQVFRYSNDRRVGFALETAERMIDKVSEHIQTGVIRLVECDLLEILSEGEKLSQLHTATHGHRGFEVLHVATAHRLGAKDFLTYDQNQTRLALAVGLRVRVRNLVKKVYPMLPLKRVSRSLESRVDDRQPFR